MGVQLQLLGRPHIRLAGESLELSSGKTSALLYYLAYQQDWVQRSDLMYLFWADSEEHKASNNLRQLLYTVKDLPYTKNLELQGGRLRWLVSSDVQDFQTALLKADWAKATHQYQGELLTGFHLDKAPEFDNWLSLERESLSRQWRDAVLKLCDELERTARFLESMSLLNRLLDANPLDEHAVQRIMTTAYQQQQVVQALQVYDRFRSHLAEELAESPMAYTQGLAEQIRNGTLDNSPTASIQLVSLSAKRLRLPSQLTPFIGREKERQEIIRRLLQAEVRLLSIIAPGGMGKTRLALAVAESLEAQFSDDVAFVSLATAEAGQILSTLASALEFSFYGGDNPKLQLLGYLCQKNMLLVLDNLEHLRDNSELIQDLLRHCPRLKLLVTSRERLNLSSEWIYELSGLHYPSTAEAKDSDLPTYDAVTYFLQEADRNQATQLPLEQVAKLCQLVQGMPLALTLAATWLRVLSLPDLLSELEQNLSLLATDAADVPERHRSMQGVFDSTWKRLTQTEQRAWVALAVFEGGFKREAAQAIADLSLPQLLSLSHKALISRDQDRFQQHPLLQQYARQQARKLGVWDSRKARHAQYYRELMVTLDDAFKSGGQLEALSTATAELANIRGSWQHALATQNYERISAMAFPLLHYFSLQVLYRDAEILFDAAARQLQQLPASEAQQLALARVLLCTSHELGSSDEKARTALRIAERYSDKRLAAHAHAQLSHFGSLAEGQAHFERSIALFEELGDEHGSAKLSLVFVWRLTTSGLYARAEQLFSKARDIFRHTGNSLALAEALLNSAGNQIFQGKFDEARAWILESHAICRASGLSRQIQGSLITLGWLEHWRGNFAEAEPYIEAHIRLYEDMGNTFERPKHLCDLSYSKGDYEQARDLALAYLVIRKQYGDADLMTGYITRILGCSLLRLNKLTEAKAYLYEAFVLYRQQEKPRGILEVAAGTAELLLKVGHRDLAIEIINFAYHNAITDARTRRELETVMSEFDIQSQVSHHDMPWLIQVLDRVLAAP